MDKPKVRDLQHELREKRKELHGRRRRLHERLAEVCEDFVFDDLTPEHRRRCLVGELQYLLDFYRDEGNWKDVV